MITGRPISGNARSRRVVSYPSMFGIATSITISAGLRSAATRSASRPPLASTISKPIGSSIPRRTARLSARSSTMRTVRRAPSYPTMSSQDEEEAMSALDASLMRSLTVKTLPLPSVLSTSILPSIRSTMRWQIEKPSPVPSACSDASPTCSNGLTLLTDIYSGAGERCASTSALRLVFTMAARAPREPLDKAPRHIEVCCDEGVGEVSLRPRHRSYRLQLAVRPRGKCCTPPPRGSASSIASRALQSRRTHVRHAFHGIHAVGASLSIMPFRASSTNSSGVMRRGRRSSTSSARDSVARAVSSRRAFAWRYPRCFGRCSSTAGGQPCRASGFSSIMWLYSWRTKRPSLPITPHIP
jgi:hypothetical protein